MLASLKAVAAPLEAGMLRLHHHVLMVLPSVGKLAEVAGLPLADRLHTTLKRRRMSPDDLAKTPVTLQTEHGGLCAYVMVDRNKPRFEQLAALRRAIDALLDEQPTSIAIGVFGDEALRTALAREAVYVAWINGVPLPARKKKNPRRALESIRLYGHPAGEDLDAVAAIARANVLARELTVLPPNELTPASYRKRLRSMARAKDWRIDEYDLKHLKRQGAGAFVAVAQGSAEADAAIVHLSYRPRGAALSVALVGKGICFDTGGHQLKSAKHMAGMHEDMNGSAVALAILQALTEQDFPLRVDAWLALAQNHIGPTAYKPGDIVQAIDGTTIEIVHTDAEGRMVLADTLALAARGDDGRPPNLIVDFATLTGSMIYSLGNRYAGVFASDDQLGSLAVQAGRASGERVTLFPMDEDYDKALESKVADVKQCTLEGEADHILAARLLKRFAGEAPWLHVDLSSANCPGGLGAVASDVTGFGVAWGVELLSRWLVEKPAGAIRLGRCKR